MISLSTVSIASMLAMAVWPLVAKAGALPIHLTVHDDPAYANALRSRRYLPLVPLIVSLGGQCVIHSHLGVLDLAHPPSHVRPIGKCAYLGSRSLSRKKADRESRRQA